MIKAGVRGQRSEGEKIRRLEGEMVKNCRDEPCVRPGQGVGTNLVFALERD